MVKAVGIVACAGARAPAGQRSSIVRWQQCPHAPQSEFIAGLAQRVIQPKKTPPDGGYNTRSKIVARLGGKRDVEYIEAAATIAQLRHSQLREAAA